VLCVCWKAIGFSNANNGIRQFSLWMQRDYIKYNRNIIGKPEIFGYKR